MARLIIVSNRIPVQFVRSENGETHVKEADGGLVNALKSYIENQDYSEIIWVGSSEIAPAQWEENYKPLLDLSYKIEPLYIEPVKYCAYYNGFSNSVIWPLFHYFPSYCEFRDANFEAYEAVNRKFFEKLRRMIKPSDIIWIHDYHLFLLPQLIRSEFRQASIGFFLHIPFPSQEIFRMLPKTWREKLLDGLLGSDLIGFQTIDYLTHFLRTVKYVLNVDNNIGLIQYRNRVLKADLFPISIDFDKYFNSYDADETCRIRQELRSTYYDRRIIFSVDRLDYTKGVIQRLLAFEKFLDQFPEYYGKVVLIIAIVPSRNSINKYSERKREIEETIARINGSLGNTQWQPIVYQYCQLSFEELTALYTASDIALITPMRDGMNLIAKEFVASRKDRKGVLILSEMTGAAHELNEAIIINPNDANEIASKLHIALTMDENEQERRMTRMQERISSYTVKDWAEDFFRELAATRHKQLKYSTSFLDFALKSYIRGKLVKSRKRLFLLDYDGTLRNYENNPGNALPTPEITELLHQLTLNDLNDVYLVSGRRMSELEKWFGHIKELKLVSEHAGLLKIADNQFCQLVEDQALDWMQEVRHIMQGVCERCPSSNLEEKDFSLVWHYRNVSSELGEYRSKELINALQELTLTYNLKVHKGKKTVEIRPADINKAVIINKLFNEYSYDFVLAIGDDNTDEDMFRILSGLNHYTVKVGVEPSFAKYHLLNPSQVLSFLRGLYYQEEGQALISA